MDAARQALVGCSAASATPRPWTGLAGLAALTLWQAWMTLTLLSPDHTIAGLALASPIVSGRHPLHLYHGVLGARAFLDRGRLCCFDPAFQAGYPKTPVFDSGSRPAEAFLALAGGTYRPAAYRIGLAICICLFPFLLFVAARGVGLASGGALVAVVLGLIALWSGPGQVLLECGDIDLLLGAFCALCYVGFLVRFDCAPGVGSWVGLVFAGGVGWFAHPLLFLLLVPLSLIYFLTVGCRHGAWWHAALLSSTLGILAINAFWLPDWLMSWWLRMPLPTGAELLTRRTFHTLWDAPLWGASTDRAYVAGLLATAALGVGILNTTRQRPAARLLGLGCAGSFFLAAIGVVWEPLGRLGASRLLVPALLFASIPAACAGASWYALIGRLAGRRAALALVVVSVLGTIAACYWTWGPGFASRFAGAAPLESGLDADRTTVVETLRRQTTDGSRILWEERASTPESSHWSALLPILTGRAFVGGLGTDVPIEHESCGLIDGTLAGRPIGAWSDGELTAFCRRYNVGWVVCWSSPSVVRFRSWKQARETARLSDHQTGALFTLPGGSFVLAGQARWVAADSERIALEEVVPEEGRVVLSLHYQPGLQASPTRVTVEKEIDPHDPIPFVRLRLDGPAAHVSLTWPPAREAEP